MKPRDVLATIVGFVLVMMLLASSSYFYSNSILETIGQVVVYIMGMSIVFGVLLYIYVKITSRSFFDPLDHVLDDEDDD